MLFRPQAERMAIPWVSLRAVTNAVFGSRRKILKNALKGLFPDADIGELLKGLNLDPECRGETLTPGEFLRIAQSLSGPVRV
jgi:16S rRNA (adenine1518-N6/adenine1519-N6)-dimethyltransferase